MKAEKVLKDLEEISSSKSISIANVILKLQKIKDKSQPMFCLVGSKLSGRYDRVDAVISDEGDRIPYLRLER